MTLTREQLDYIKRSYDRGPDSNGHRSSALEIMAAGQFVGIDFPSVESIEEVLRELRARERDGAP